MGEETRSSQRKTKGEKMNGTICDYFRALFGAVKERVDEIKGEALSKHFAREEARISGRAETKGAFGKSAANRRIAKTMIEYSAKMLSRRNPLRYTDKERRAMVYPDRLESIRKMGRV
jgi:hypothetical protein